MLRLLLLLFIAIPIYAEDPLVIRHADRFEYLDRDGMKYQRLIGHVEILYKASVMTADTAIHYHTLERIDFLGHAKFDYSGQFLEADRISYFKKDSSATTDGHVVLYEKEHKIRITGGKGDYSRSKEESRIWDKPVLTRIDSVSGDTLFIVSRLMRHQGRNKKAFAEDSVFIRQGKIRAECRLAEYDQVGEKVLLLQHPSVFYEKSRLSGDTIILYFQDNALSRIRVTGNANGLFLDDSHNKSDSEQVTLINGDTLLAFLKDGEMERSQVIHNAVGLSYFRCDTARVNRLTGKQMLFFLSGKAIDSLEVRGNATSLYYYEEEKERGRNETSGDTLNIYFEERRIHRITAKGAVQGVYCSVP